MSKPCFRDEWFAPKQWHWTLTESGGSRFPHSRVICDRNIGEGKFFQNIHEFTYELLICAQWEKRWASAILSKLKDKIIVTGYKNIVTGIKMESHHKEIFMKRGHPCLRLDKPRQHPFWTHLNSLREKEASSNSMLIFPRCKYMKKTSKRSDQTEKDLIKKKRSYSKLFRLLNPSWTGWILRYKFK